MFLVAFVAFSVAAVPLARGRVMKLAGLRFRRLWLVALSMPAVPTQTILRPKPARYGNSGSETPPTATMVGSSTGAEV